MRTCEREVNGLLLWLVDRDEWGSEEEQAFEGWFKEVNKLPPQPFWDAWKEVAMKFVPLCLEDRRLRLFQNILEHYPVDALKHLQEIMVKCLERIINDPELFIVVRHSCPHAIRDEVFVAMEPILRKLREENPQGFDAILSKCQHDKRVVQCQQLLEELKSLKSLRGDCG